MRFGVNSFVWVSPCTTAAVKELSPKVKSMGFDILEIACENPELLDIQSIRNVIEVKRAGRHYLWSIWTGPKHMQF